MCYCDPMRRSPYCDSKECQEQLKRSKEQQDKHGLPPLGLIPKNINDAKRFNEVCGALVRYYNANLPIEIEWVEEYNELVKKLYK